MRNITFYSTGSSKTAIPEENIDDFASAEFSKVTEQSGNARTKVQYAWHLINCLFL